jgi:hypothetical protein
VPKPKAIGYYYDTDLECEVTVYEPEEDWPPVRREFYGWDSRPARAVVSDSIRKSIASGEGEANRCSLAIELGGTFVNDPYYKVRK